MAGTSDYLSNARLNWIKGTAHPAAPSTVYLALYTSAPTDAGGGTEVGSGVGYARQAITLGTIGAASGSGRQVSNTNTITFGPATGAGFGTVTHFGIFDALTSGNLLYWDALGASQSVPSGQSYQLTAGGVTVKED